MTATYRFKTDDWRNDELVRFMPAVLADDNVVVSYVDYINELYPLALANVFSFLSTHANGRYSDRTMMTIRRAADRWAESTKLQRATHVNDNAPLPYILVAESPFSWDEETEIKRGGILGALICLPNDENEWRGVLAVADSARRKGLGKALISGQRAFTNNINWFAHQTNFPAMRLAASMELSPIQVNSSTGTIQYGMPPARRR